MTNDELLEQAKIHVKEALRQTQIQTEDAAAKAAPLLRLGAEKLKQAADALGQAIRNDINRRP
jgi:hypothetical protein